MSSTCQSDHLGRLLGQCEHRMRMVMDRSLRQYGVTPVQCRALMYLHRQPEPVTQRQLEQYMAVKPSTINGIVGRLEEKGLLTRDACQQDARCRVLRLTEEGRRFRSDFIRIAQKTNRQMEQGFSPEELATLHRYLERVAAKSRNANGGNRTMIRKLGPVYQGVSGLHPAGHPLLGRRSGAGADAAQGHEQHRGLRHRRQRRRRRPQLHPYHGPEDGADGPDLSGAGCGRSGAGRQGRHGLRCQRP